MGISLSRTSNDIYISKAYNGFIARQEDSCYSSEPSQSYVFGSIEELIEFIKENYKDHKEDSKHW